MPITRRRRANPPDQPENHNQLAEQTENSAEAAAPEQPANTPGESGPSLSVAVRTENISHPVANGSSSPVGNGERVERQEYTPTIEGGRRTSRGELFRRPPQPPVSSTIAPLVGGSPLQPPSHEISLPLGNLLHLAYNPGYTGADEARSTLLQQLAQESKNGGRARCWSCGSLAVAYDRWNTRSKNFGEVGIAFCEICGVWSVM